MIAKRQASKKISKLRMKQMRSRSTQANKLCERVTKNLDTYTPEAAARLVVRDIEQLLWEMLGLPYSRDVLTAKQKARIIKRLKVKGDETMLIKTGKKIKRVKRMGKSYSELHHVVRNLVYMLSGWGRPRRQPVRKARFEHESGGTMLVSKSRYPSDDSYFDHVTGRRYEVTSSIDAHFQMPHWVDDLKDITKISGVNPKVKELR
jgi:hypothetical protein